MLKKNRAWVLITTSKWSYCLIWIYLEKKKKRQTTEWNGDQDALWPSHQMTKTCFHHTWWIKWFPTCLSSLTIIPAGRPRYFIHCFRWPVHFVCHTRWPRHDTCQLHHCTRWSRQHTCLSHQVIKTSYLLTKTSYLSITPSDQDIIPVYHTRWSRHPAYHTNDHDVLWLSVISGDRDIWPV